MICEPFQRGDKFRFQSLVYSESNGTGHPDIGTCFVLNVFLMCVFFPYGPVDDD